MNSLELYSDYFQKSKMQPLNPEQKSILINDVVKNVFAELNVPPFELKNSPFVVEIENIMQTIMPRMHWKGKNVAIIDAFAIVHGVKQSFIDKSYSVTSDENISCYIEYFFKNVDAGNEEKEFIANINQNLNSVQKILRELQDQSSVPTAPASQDFQVEIQTQPAAEMQTLGRSSVTPQSAPTILKSQQLSTAQPVQIPAKAEENPIMQEYTAKKIAQIEWQTYIAETEAEHTKQLAIRRKDNWQKILAWHNEHETLIQSVKDLQQPAQALLEDLRNFSKTLTENYIVQFASAQIELFNLIADCFRSHAPRAEKSQNKDYYNAVMNYESYLEMIVDALADFGVEEISSSAGTRFDGKIHDVKNTKNFYPQTATIKNSLRSGFRYGDLILQKESVEV